MAGPTDESGGSDDFDFTRSALPEHPWDKPDEPDASPQGPANPPMPGTPPPFSSPSTMPGSVPASDTTPKPPTPPPPPLPAPSVGTKPTAPVRPGGRDLNHIRDLYNRLMEEISRVYVGQEEFVRATLVALFSNGHVLIESVPGLGKTLLVRVLSRVLGCNSNRIQFTADLMPSDITGQPIFDMREQKFRFRPGPVFTQLLLADEINRSPAKTHAALLEIMQERRVTVDGTSHQIDLPFLVLATQNPIESEGTYNLPEAQLDRFMFKLVVDYPEVEEESDILRLHCRDEVVEDQLESQIRAVTGPEEILAAQQQCRAIQIHDKMVDYITALVRKTRDWPSFYMGASPRAGIALLSGARTLAAFAGRDYVVPDDVVELVQPTLRHRVILAPEAEVEGRHVDELLTEIIRAVEVPRQ